MIGEVDKKPFDAWTLMHTGVGFGAGYLRMNPWIYGAAILLYEVVENMAEGSFRKSIFGASKPESELNVIADLGVGLLGYVAGRWVNR